MKKFILLSILFIIGCATKEINSTTTILSGDEIIAECKIECKTYTISSDEWYDCMHQCNSNKLNKMPLVNRIYVEECWTDSTKKTNP